MKTIVVNNPAAQSGGALTILKQFLDNIYEYDRKNNYFVIVSLEHLKKYENKNIKIIVVPRQNFKKRIMWDNFFLKKELKNKKINPDIFISLQNTGVNLSRKINQIVYFHQSIPLSEKKWNFFKRNERKYWFYKNIYPFFIKLYLNRINTVVVQAEWIKNSFSNFFDYDLNKILIIKPNINIPLIDKVIYRPKNKFRIFYPAAPFEYKNHSIILESLSKIKEYEYECLFTYGKGENLILDKLLEEKNLQNKVKLLGKIPYEEVLEYYKSSDLLIYPSSIETIGLPLIEASTFGLSILSIDKPYAREVLKNYKGVTFIDEKDIKKWSELIVKEIKEPRKRERSTNVVDNEWKYFFEIIKNM